MTAKGASRLTATVLTNMTPEMRERIDEIAAEHESSVGSVVRIALRQYLRRLDREREKKEAAAWPNGSVR
jgi:hypothetical protein